MEDRSQFVLLTKRRFGPFFTTQFLGAFNDNLFKNALIVMLAFQATDTLGLSSNTLINLAAGLFILPFFLFSASFGQLADKLEKSRLIRLTKLLEMGIMLGAAVGFISGNVWLLIGLLFLMGIQSALFGPVKYAILPQHLQQEELVGGNGLVETGTFLAILLGTMAGGVLIALKPHGAAVVAGVAMIVAAAGYLSSRGIPTAAAMAPDLRINWNPLSETWRTYRLLRGNRTVFLSVLGISWFWFFGASYLAQLPNYTKLTLGGNEQVVTLLLTLFSVGVGAGSLLCERLSGHKVEIGLVPFGSIGMTVFSIDLYFAPPGHAGGELLGMMGFLDQGGGWRVLFDILMLGMFGGFYIVPLYSLIQQRSEPAYRSRIIAGNNILNALFMVASALLAIVALGAGLTIPQLFLLTAFLNAAVAVYIYTLVPEFLMRFIVWILIHIMYRIDQEGLDRIPDEGPAVLVCNHVSFMDALVISGCVRRPIRFVMYHKIFGVPLLSFVFRTARAIPIAPAREDPKLLEQANDSISGALKDGQLVCIFPEGEITRHGELNPFKSGIEHIVKRDPVPVIPIALCGLWGSFFSRRYGEAMMGVPRRFRSKIGIHIGIPQAPEVVVASRLQSQVQALRGEWQ
jgi:1-acyl-sn-glycerol-3-phosphate acyltransferase